MRSSTRNVEDEQHQRRRRGERDPEPSRAPSRDRAEREQRAGDQPVERLACRERLVPEAFPLERVDGARLRPPPTTVQTVRRSI
jgi:hypothetical protein